MKVSVRMEGLSELRANMAEIKSAAMRKKTVIAGASKALEPMRDTAREFAPKGDTGDLSEGIDISTKLSRRQERINNRSGDKSDVEVYMGPSAETQYATENEFGTEKMEAQPYMRPAWDMHKRSTLESFAAYMRDAIETTRARVAKAAERRAARMKRGT
jgi:HK97 gp10 family phage protein